MPASRVIVPILCLCVAVFCLGLWTSAGSAHESPSPLDLSVPASNLSFNVGRDSWINADAVTTNYGTDKELWIGLYGQAGKTYERETLLWFDVSGLPAGAIVDSAKLELMLVATYDAEQLNIWPYQVLDDWGEMSVTWNGRPPSSSAGDPAASVDTALGVKQWDVTKIVKAWRAGAKDYGILLAGDGMTLGTRVFGAREGGGDPGRLTITYHLPATTTATPTATRTRTVTPSRTPTPTVTEPPQAFSDLGDAPDSSNSAGKQMQAYVGVWAGFPTVHGAGSPPVGPLHRNQPLRYWLGSYISTEFEADTGYDEDGGNNLRPADGLADRDLGDDGVELPAAWEHCKPMQLTFHVTSSISEAASAVLNVWADWNGNGAWGDELHCGQTAVSEWGVRNMKVSVPGYGRHTFTTPAFRVYRPDGAGPFWLRVTLSDSDAIAADGSGPSGGWADGETEDYLIAGSADLTPTPTASRTPMPTPTATRTPTRTPTPTATLVPPLPDIRITGMEITQGMQNLDNQMSLVRWRETRVRAYIFSVSGLVTGVRARLRAYRPEGIELPGSPVWCEWPVSTHAGALVRTNLYDAFYFYVPVQWREGQVRFRLEVNPDHAITESDYSNNIYEQRVQFYAAAHDLAVIVRPFDGSYLQGWTYNVSDPLIQSQTLQSLKRYFPTIRLFTIGDTDLMGEPFWCSFHNGGDMEGWQCMHARVKWWSDHTSDDYVRQHYVGMVHPNVNTGPTGGIGAVGGQSLWVKVSTANNPAWYSVSGGILAHELGHNRGLNHVNCSGGEDWGGTHPEWVERGYPWPYPNCRLAPVDVWGYYGLDVQHAVARRPGPTVLTNDPNGPEYNRAWPLMGYRTPRWISPWELCRYLVSFNVPCSLTWGAGAAAPSTETVLADPAAYAPADQVAALTAATDFIQVHGRVWRDGAQAELWHVLRTTSPVEKAFQVQIEQMGKRAELGLPASVPGVTVVQLSASGAVLDSAPVYLEEVTEPVPWLDFVELLPRAEGAVRVQIRSGATVLAERAASGYAPVITLLEPNGGIIGMGTMVRWTASDADSDTLRFEVLFSPDDGANWQVVAQDIEGTSVQVNTLLKGTKVGRMAVIAMDGFWTTTDRSDDYLTVENNPPQPLITAPEDGAFAPIGSLVVLTGQAYDPEDRTIPDAGLAWRSSLDGGLGSGPEIPLRDLTAGKHVITLTATDSAGKTAEATIEIHVGTTAIYLPLVLRK